MGNMQEIPEDFERALKRHEPAIRDAVSKVSRARDGKNYALAAFRGGDRSAFASEDDIARHYEKDSAEARRAGRSALDALLREMSDAVDNGLRINVVTASQVQAAVPLIRDDAALVRFASEFERRHDYTVIAAVGRCSGGDGKPMKAARAVRSSLDAYEHSLSECLRKTEKFVSRALDGDKACSDCWADWVNDNADASRAAYEALQAAVSGEKVDLGAAGLMDAYTAN